VGAEAAFTDSSRVPVAAVVITVAVAAAVAVAEVFRFSVAQTEESHGSDEIAVVS